MVERRARVFVGPVYVSDGRQVNDHIGIMACHGRRERAVVPGIHECQRQILQKPQTFLDEGAVQRVAGNRKLVVDDQAVIKGNVRNIESKVVPYEASAADDGDRISPRDRIMC